MKNLNFEQMEMIEGGVNCQSAGHGATVLGALGLGLTVVALVASGPVGIAAGIMASIWDIGAGAAGVGIGIACW